MIEILSALPADTLVLATVIMAAGSALQAAFGMGLALLPAVAVAAWQSFLSMVIRNFAMPIALGAVTGVISFGSIAAGAHAMQFVLPPVGLSKALWMGSSAVADANALDPKTVASITLTAAVLAVAGWLASTMYLRRVDVNA